MSGANVAYRLVQEDIDTLGRSLHGFAIDTHMILCQIDARPLCCHSDTIDLHTSGGDQFFCMPSKQYVVFYQSDSSCKGQNDVTEQYICTCKAESHMVQCLT